MKVEKVTKAQRDSLVREELINKLVEFFGYNRSDIEEVDIQQLENLVKMETENDNEDALDNVEKVEDDVDSVRYENRIVLDVPLQTSPEWNSFVLEQFSDEELFDGNPTVDGLRRVTELLLGTIAASETHIAQVPSPDNGERATAVVSVTILQADTGEMRVFSGAADACPDNLDTKFAKYPVAMAETRAEGRALRKALRLRNIAAEEVKGGEQGQVDESKSEPLSTAQVTMIDTLAGTGARGLNINVEKLVKKLAGDGVLVYNSMKELTKEDGAKIMKALSAHQSAKDLIPEELIGYETKWQNAKN